MRPLVRRLKRPGIRAQVLLGFTAFTALIVALLWFFQIGLLNTFYKAIKTNEIRAVSNRVVEMLDSGASMADFIEITYSANVSILLADKNGTNISVSPNARGSVLERFDTIDCRMLFLEAKAAGGSVLEDNLEQAAGDIGAGILYAQIGTGLGLSIVKNILDMHGGRYGVTSMVGQGSTFWFELPEYTEPPAPRG